MATQDPTPDDEAVIACLLSEREFAIRGEELAQGLFALVEATSELLDGFGFRFADDPAILADLLEFIAAERRCCPFLAFELAFAPYGGPVWLRLRGSGRIKAFVAETFVARASGDGASAALLP
jgi:hypothetical protein